MFADVGKACLELPGDSEIVKVLGGFSTPESRATQASLEAVKTQLVCLGLVRILRQTRTVGMPKVFLGPGSRPTTQYVPEDVAFLAWELTEYGRMKLGELIGARRSQAASAAALPNGPPLAGRPRIR